MTQRGGQDHFSPRHRCKTSESIPLIAPCSPFSGLGAAVHCPHVGGTEDPSRQLLGALDLLVWTVLPDPSRLELHLLAPSGNVLDNQLCKLAHVCNITSTCQSCGWFHTHGMTRDGSTPDTWSPRWWLWPSCPPPPRGAARTRTPPTAWCGEGGGSMYHQGLVATKQEVAQNKDNVNIRGHITADSPIR